MSDPVFRVVPDATALATVAAAHIAAAARAAIADHGRFVLALSGGTTPGATYERLATHYASVVDWEHVHVLFVDERCVPPSEPASNFRMADEALLSKVPIPPAQVHRMQGELDPATAAAAYAQAIAPLLDGGGIDLVILGMGADGHTASLFPGSSALASSAFVVPVEAPAEAQPVYRVTLTLPALARAKEVLFLILGASKAEAVESIRAGTGALPAARVEALNVTFLLDETASSA